MAGNAAGPDRAATMVPSPAEATRQAIEWVNPGAAEALVMYCGHRFLPVSLY
jgi:hypothetical protein